MLSDMLITGFASWEAVNEEFAADTGALEEVWAVEGHEVAFQDVFPFR